MQGLARKLVRDAQHAEDLAQETMVEALRRPPLEALNLRGWLATVLRRRASHARREALRRQERETRVAIRGAESIDNSAAQRMLQHRELVERVLALDEPYRTVIVLQFFDGLAPREIAAKLGLPVNTVRSRVQRGLEQLRARLGASSGGGDKWIAAMVNLGWPRAGGTFAATFLGAGIFAQAKFLVATAVLLIAGLWYFLSTDSVAKTSAPQASVAASAPRESADMSPSGNSPAQAPQRVAQPTAKPAGAQRVAAAPAARLAGFVLDTAGQPLAGLRVRRHGRLTPRWQAGDLGYISDGERSVFVPEELLTKLRADPAAAAKFFANFKASERLDEWRALILGESCPARETTTAVDGGFEFSNPGADTFVDIVEPGWQTLANGHDTSGALVWIAARSIEIAGQVQGPDWQPLPDSKVVFTWSPELALGRLSPSLAITDTWQANRINSDNNGRYLLRKIPAGLIGASLEAVNPGLAPAIVPAPEVSVKSFDIVFSGESAAGLLDIDGKVVDGKGGALAGAEVLLARQKTRTDAEGRFAFMRVEVADSGSLTVLSPGFAAYQREGLITAVRRDPKSGRGILIVLDQPVRSLRGVVLGADGKPLDDVRVNVFDPALLDFSVTTVEGRLGGWEQGVPTDSAGRFELSGLSLRAYRLRAWRPDDSFTLVSELFPAGTNDVVLRVGPETIFGEVRGRVVCSSGPLPAELTVAIAYPIHVTRSGAGSTSEAGPLQALAADGTFTLVQVPRRGAFFVLMAKDHAPVLTPVEFTKPDGSVELEFTSQRILNVLTRGPVGNASLTVVDAEDRPLDVDRFSAGTRVRTRVLLAQDGMFAPLRIPSEARAVLLQRENGSWQRFLIGDDDVGISQVVVN